MQRSFFQKWILLVLFIVVGTNLSAQRDGQFPNQPTNSTGFPQDSFPLVDSLPFVRVSDTVGVTYIFSANPSQEFVYGDTLLERNLQQYDPARQRTSPYSNLGNIGAPARANLYELRSRQGFDAGFHQYDIYKIKAAEQQYFTLAPAFTKLYYSQGNDQNDSVVDAVFGRKFDGGTSLSLHYRRLLHSLNDDELPLNKNAFYKYQAARHTNVGVGLSFESKNKRYQSFLTYAFNQNRNFDHGGIIPSALSDSLLVNGNTIEQTSLSVFQPNETSLTRHNENVLNYTQHYRFGGTTDSLGNTKRNLQFSHQLQYKKQSYKFSETAPDSNYYNTVLLTDTRALRHFIKVVSIENQFSINTFKARKGSIKAQKDLIEVGLLHRYNSIAEEPTDTVVQNLFLNGKWNFKPNERVEIQTYAHLGLWNQAGDYQIKGDFFFDLKQLGKLRLHAHQQLYEPSLVQTRAYITERKVWSNNWKKTLETQLGGTWARPEWQLEITANFFLLNNYIYFDTLASPAQYENAFSIGQLIVQKDITLGKFHLDNTVALQQNSANAVLRLPSFYTKNSLYYEGYLFKQKMLARTGFDLSMNSTYQADTYQAAIGQFHLQDTKNIDLYPALDVFFNFKVDRFQAFFKVENLTALLTKEVYYQTPYYPQKETYFRFGITWIFMDAPLKANKTAAQKDKNRPVR